MNVYLIRHGKDDEKYRGGWSSHPLIEEGIEQSKKLAEYLEDKQSEFNIQKIISSDLKRAAQTADIINKKLNLPIEYTDKLREMNNGDIAGMLNEEAQIKYPGLYYNTLAIDEKYPGGESPIDFYNRISQNFNEIINENANVENIVLVTHSGVINIIYHIIKEKEWSNKEKGYPSSNASIHKLVIDGDNKYFEIENLKEHLQ